MKRYVRALVLGVCVATAGVAHADATQEFDSMASVLEQRLDKGEITEMMFAKDMADLAKAIFPNDYRYQSLRNYRVLLASRLERGDIKRDEFEYLWSEKRLQYLADREKDRHQQVQALQQQDASDQAARDMAIGHALGSFGRSITNATRPTGVRCVSTPVGASVSTYCN
jgi:hypothetical protein